MNKMKKLLSVILAVVIALSALSIMGSAAKANYKTVAELEALDAYSPYGQVTRLSTEERASIVLDFLDNMLPGLGINMGEVFNVLGLSVTLDLSNVDRLCYSLDTVAKTKSNFLYGIAAGIVDLGIVETLDMDTWAQGFTRAGKDQLALFSELFELLSNNTTLVNEVLTDGLNLGMIGGLIGGDLDLSSIDAIVKDLPTLVKGLVFPMLERWDDTFEEVQWLDTNGTGDGKVKETINTFVQKLFNNNMSITTVKYDVNGTMTSEHKGMPFATAAPGAPSANSSRYVYVMSTATPVPDTTTLTVYHIVDKKEAEDLAKDDDPDNDAAVYTYVKEEFPYVLTQEVEGSGTYVWKSERTDDVGNTWTETLKWYNDESQFLKGFDGTSINLTTMSAGELLYTFIPVVFKNLATVVLNGSVKKILAEFFGAKFTHLGTAGSEEILALGNDPIFAEEQGDYVFEWSDYAIVDGVHYYRYLDDVYVGDISNKNNYFDIINWNFEITDDFMNEFVPASDDNAGSRLLLNLNNFLIKVVNTVVLPSAETVDLSGSDTTATWTLPTLVVGDNSNLINNIKAFAQALVSLSPMHIFGSDYETNPRCYYDLFMSDDNDTILTGIAAQLVDIIMPSMTLPSADDIIESGAKVGAILAAVVREFAAYLTPEFNYDALIYTDFGTSTEDPVKSFVTGKDSEYWFDVILTMGANVGFEYIRAFADMGEDSAEWAAFVAYSGYAVDGKTYAAGTTREALNAEWEGMIDYVIDWALDKDYEWSWKMENLVDTTGLTIDMATAQDPFLKLDKILFDIIPFEEILKIEPAEGQSKVEHFLREDLILGLVDLKWDHLINTLQFDGTNRYFRDVNVLDALATIVKGIVNSLFRKIGGGDYEFIPAAITNFDNLANHANIRTLAVNLVGRLFTAYNNGLLDTVAPFLGFLLGWKTNPQEVADAQVWTEFRDGKDYALQSGNTIDGSVTKIKFLNNSAGMLEKHNSPVVGDHAYDITIREVTDDATTNTLNFTYGDGNGVCSPWETLDINISGNYVGEEAVTVTIAYDYVGKDGKAIGGTQYTSVTFLVSNQSEDADIEGRKDGDDSDGNYGIDPYKRYQFTEDIYTTVTTYRPSVWGDNGTFSGTSNFKKLNAPEGTEYDCDENVVPGTEINMNELASTYFAYYQNQDGGWGNSFPKDGSTSGLLYYAKDGVTAETEFPYGTYDMGAVAIKYSDAYKCWEIDYIYYNDYDIGVIYEENKNNAYHANQGVDPAIYNEYNEAWKLIVYGATYPMMTEANGHADTDYVKTIQPYIPAAIERFEAAKEAYETALAQAQASGASAALPAYVATLRDEIEDDFVNGKEINFQDYEYYEYFNYQDEKQAGEALYRTYLQPEIMDTYYIQGSGIRQAELDYVIANAKVANPIIAAGITASRMENDEAAINASITAHDEWEQPINTKLKVDDMTARIVYYESFLNSDTAENNDHLYFLEKEIAHVEAQGLVADDYEANSWGRYAYALNEAKKVAAGTDEYAAFNSRIYDVKYNLMVAYKQLLLKENSLIEAGGTAELLANIDKANEIFASLAAGDGVWALKEGVEANEAYADLISALGYKYQAVYTEHDIEVQMGEQQAGNLKYNDDRTPMMFNLYADSAIEYAENDRPNKSANQAKVNVANANLVAAMENFAKTVTAEPELGGIETGVVDVENGYVYGVTAGDDVELFFAVENGTFEMVANEAGYTNGTGATLVVKDLDGNEVAYFTLVVFGDVNGDAAVSATDANFVTNAYLGGAIEGDAYNFAADANGDGNISATDANIVTNAYLGGDISVNPYAA